MDVSYLNICGTFYYFCGILDGCSRYIVHWEIRPAMTEAHIEIILQRAKEKFPQAHPRVISDNGPQFIARDFKEFIRLSGMTHVRTSPFYPQSNGKVEHPEAIDQLPNDQMLVIYCDGADCHASQVVFDKLEELGFVKENMKVFSGGWVDWVKNKGEIEKSEGEENGG